MRRTACSLAIFALPGLLHASLISPSFKGLAATPGGVVIYHYGSEKVLKFDFQGGFVEEIHFLVDGKPLSRPTIFTDRNGQYCVRSFVRDEDDEIVSTIFCRFDASGKLMSQRTLEGDWEARQQEDGTLFVSQIEDKKLKIYVLPDMATGEKRPYAEFALEQAYRVIDLGSEPAVEWTVDSKGQVILLVSKSERGVVQVYDAAGRLLRHWEVRPEPVTSVSYMKGILVDQSNNIYVTHSSWEVSPSTENSGSILKYDPAGTLQFRVKEKIGYLQDVAVANDGSIFMYQLGDEIFKYGSNGRFLLSWVAEPPKYGMSWEQIAERRKKAEGVKQDSPLQDLVDAAVFGSMTMRYEVARWIEQRGPDAIPVVTDAMLHYRDENGWSELEWPTEKLWDRHPDQAFLYLKEEFLSGDESVRQCLAPHLVYRLKGEVPGLREVLTTMLDSPNERLREAAEYAIEEIGGGAEVVQKQLEELRKSVASGEPSWGAAYSISENYQPALPLIEPILLDPEDPIRDSIRCLVIESWEHLTTDDEDIPDEVIQRTLAWQASADQYVADTAALALTGYGIPGHQQRALDALRRCPALIPPGVSAFTGLARKDPEELDRVAGELFEAAVKYAATTEKRPEAPLGDLVRICTPGIQKQAVKALGNPGLPAISRREIVGVLAWSLDDCAPETVVVVLSHPQWFVNDLEMARSYCTLLEKIPEDYGGAHDVRNQQRAAALYMIEKLCSTPPATSPLPSTTRCQVESPDPAEVLASALSALAPMAEKTDLEIVRPLLRGKDTPANVRYSAVEVVVHVGVTPELMEVLVSYLRDDNLCLVAAEALAPTGHPDALPVLVEKGLKRMGHYSRIMPDPQLFVPYGDKGLKVLEELMDYPNTGTQHWVRIILAELKDTDVYPRIQKEFNQFIAQGKVPPGYLVECMALYGQDPLPAVIEQMAKQADACQYNEMYFLRINDRLVKQLRQMLLAEKDIARAQAIARILDENHSDEARQTLEELRASHPSPEIRRAIQKQR